MGFTPQTTTYDFDQLSSIFGPIITDDFEQGGISVEHTEPTFTMIVSLDGKVTRSKTLNHTAKVTITVLSSSATNDQFAAWLTLDRDAPNGAGITNFFLKDNSGRSVYEAPEAWIEGPPAATFVREASARAWVICCSKLDRFEGGN